MTSVFEAWPTQDEIRTTTPEIAHVKDLLLARDMRNATDALLDLLYRTAGEATQIGHVMPGALLGFVRSVDITRDVDTAQINIRTGYMRISPIFFLRFIHSVRDLVWIIVHEREHRIIQMLHGSPYNGRATEAEMNLAEDVFVEANTRFMLNGATGNDDVQLVAQTEQRAKRKEPALPVLDPESRYTLATSKWSTFNGKQKSNSYRQILAGVEAKGADSESYEKYVEAWLAAFPPDSGMGDGSLIFGGGGSVATAAAPPPRAQQDRILLPVAEDASIVETVLNTLDGADPRRTSLQVLAQHNRWSRQLADTIVSDVLAYAHQDPTILGTSLYPVLDRAAWLALACGTTPASYTAKYEVQKESPAYALYVDVSGSMEDFYGVIAPLARMLGPHCCSIRQFSTIVHEVDANCRYAYTTQGTDYDVVAEDVFKEGFQSIIVLTDNTVSLSDENLKRLRSACIDVYLLSTTPDDYRSNGFNAVARKRVNLNVRPT